MAEERPPGASEPAEAGTPLASRVLGSGVRATQRIADATRVNDALDGAVEEAIVGAMESPAVERALVRLAEEGKLQRVIERAVATSDIEEAVNRAVDSEVADRVWENILASDKAQMLVERVAEAPEVRAAIAQQGFGLITDIGRQVSRITEALDDVFERVAHAIIRRPGHDAETNQAGLVTRAVAVALDGALLFGALSLGAGLLSSIVPVAFGRSEGLSGLAVAGIFAFAYLAAGTYLVTFWSLVGQTPGMRFLGIRVQAGGRNEIGLRRALGRLFAIPLAILPFGLGVLAILVSPRRRALYDVLAGTEVIYDEASAPWSLEPREWAAGDNPPGSSRASDRPSRAG